MVDDEDSRGYTLKRILVIGDAIADVYRECVFKKMCPEDLRAPAVVESARETLPGGAANVAVNLAALSPSSHVDLIAVLDHDLARAVKFSSRSTVDMSRIVDDRPLIKERIVCGGEICVRVDNSRHVSSYAAERIFVQLREYLAERTPDLILLSDYAGGTVNQDSFRALLRHRERMIVDTKLTDLSVFGGDPRTMACKLNRSEWESVLEGDHSPERNFRFFIVTDGAKGARVSSHSGMNGKSTTHTLEIAGHRTAAVDVNGCGDTFLAGLAAGIVRTNDPVAAVEFANAAAATVVVRRRTAVADLDWTLGLLGMGNEVSTRGTCADHRDPAPRVDRGM